MGIMISLIASNGYITVNKTIAHMYGLEAAVILGELASEYEYWTKVKRMPVDGYFFSTVENVEKNTTLTRKRQQIALKVLQDAGIVDVKLMGLPAKRHIKLNEEVLLKNLLNKVGQTGLHSSSQMDELESPNGTTNNNNITIIKNNEDGYAREEPISENLTLVNSSSPTLTEGEHIPSPSCGAPPPRDPAYAEVSAEYHKNFGLQPMGVVSDILSYGIKNTCKEAVIYAIHSAKAAMAKSPYRYAEKVIHSMIAAGVRDAQGVEAYKATHETSTATRAPARKGKTLDELLAEAEAEENGNV